MSGLRLALLSWSRPRAADEPVGWTECVGLIAAALGSPPPERRSWRALLRPRLCLSWHPCLLTFAAALLGRDLVYLCWGFARQGDGGWRRRLRNLRLRLILRRARLVLCNDPVTRRELAARFGVTAVQVLYPVDVDWFRSGAAPARRPDILIPGSNDRDEALARGIAQSGQPVLRVTQEPRVAAWHRANLTPGLTLLADIPFAELRTLYRACRAVALPLTETEHAAGQTAALEALAAGAPLLVAEGFSSAIVADYPGVRVLPADSPAAAWIAAVAEAVPPEPGGPIDAHAPGRAAAAIAEAIRAALGRERQA